jgi:hypothetical protein
MDTGTLVEGGAEGLLEVVRILESQGVSILGAYLIRLTSEDGYSETNFRIVTNDDQRDVIYKFVRLRREKRLPALSDDVRISPVRPNHVEATRVLDYASRLGTPPVSIKEVFWDGLFIEDAVVVKLPSREHAVA